MWYFLPPMSFICSNFYLSHLYFALYRINITENDLSNPSRIVYKMSPADTLGITGSFSLMTWQDKSEIRSVLLYDFQSRSYIFNQSKALSSLDRKRERSRLLQRWTSSLRRLSWPRIGLRRWHHRVQAAVCKFNRLTRVVSRLANLRIDKMLSSVDKGKVL